MITKIKIIPLLINYSDNKPYLTINKKEKINRSENSNEEVQINDKPFLIEMNDKINFQEMEKNKTINEDKSFRFKNKFKFKKNGITKTKTSPNEKPVIESQKCMTNINIFKYLDNDNEDNILKNRIDNKEINGENEENYKFNNSINNKSIDDLNNINIKGSDFNNEDKYHKNYSLNGNIKYERLNSLIESDNYDNKKLYSSLEINEPNHIKNKSNIYNLIDKSIENESGNDEDKNKILNSETIQDLGNKEEERIINGYMQNSRLRKLNKRNKKLGLNEMDFLI